MAVPGEGISTAWRNQLVIKLLIYNIAKEDVERFLLTNHTNHFKIFNLSEGGYDCSRLGNDNVIFLGWPDHHAPSLDHLLQILHSINNWLEIDPENVAIIHCKVIFFYNIKL
jgi:phosphatidylinositol-3,4,5-trisphosphate 3-phosphatase/dual-specificity protein phosphatase PTEN